VYSLLTLQISALIRNVAWVAPPPEVSEHDLAEWNLLWNTFWGKPAPECFVKVSARIPDLRTLATQETNYMYLKLPNDDLFPCGLDRILITETYTNFYEKLCEQDRLYTEMSQSERRISLTHSTIVTGQPGTGERLTPFGISVALNDGMTF